MYEYFSSYKRGVRQLLQSLDRNGSHYRDALALQARLLENLAETRRVGNVSSLRSERVRIIDALNAVALEIMQVSFNEICGLDQQFEEPEADLIDWQHLLKSLVDSARKASVPLLMLSLGWTVIAILFGKLIIPAMKTTLWTEVTGPKGDGEVVRDKLILRRDANQEVYLQTKLLSADAYPTTLGIHVGPEGKIVYAGTYGVGLYISEDPSEWKCIGLENSIVTRVLVRKNDPRQLLVATDLGVFSSSDGGDSWESKGPVSDLVTALERSPLNPNVLLAGTTQGVFWSADEGNTWIGPSLTEETITSIAFALSDPEVAYLSCLRGATYRSNNGGREWYRIRPSDELGSAPLAVSPDDPNLVYIGPAAHGIYRSSDGGSKWTYLGLNGVSISSILLSSVVDGAIFVGADDGKGMYVSWDRGQSWQNTGVLRDSVISIAEDLADPGVVLVTTAQSGLLRTRDGGQSWVGMGLGRPTFGLDFQIADLAVTPTDAEHLYAIPSDRPGLFESTDGGASWSPVKGLAELMGSYLGTITVNPYSPTEIYVSAFGGAVFHSIDEGTSWSSITYNLPRGGHAPIAVSENNALFAGPSDKGVWTMAPSSSEWTPTGLSTGFVEKIWVDPEGDRIFALDEQGVLHVSLNRGQTWYDVSPKFETLAGDSPTGKHLLGVSESLDIMASDDSGRTWRILGRLTSGGFERVQVTSFRDRPGSYYLTYGLNAISTVDYGDHWVEALELPVRGIHYAATRSRLYLVAYSDLYASDDFGQRWFQVRYGETESSFTHFAHMGQDVELAGTQDSGLFFSRDNGKTWRQSTIGSGHEVLQLWVNNRLDPPEAIALIKGSEDVYLVSSRDARVWNQQPVPCDTAGELVASVLSEEGPVWHIRCEEPPSVVVIRPGQNLDSVRVRLPEDFSALSDVIHLLNGTTYLKRSGYQNDNYLWVSTDNGSTWYIGGYISEAEWELSDDTRSGVLVLKQEGGFSKGLSLRSTTPWLVYVALGLCLLLFSIIVLRPSTLITLLRDLWATVLRILFPVSDVRHENMSPVFLWMVCPVLLVSSILALQLLPLELLHRLNTYITENSTLVYYWGRLLDRLPIMVVGPEMRIYSFVVVVSIALSFSVAGTLIMSMSVLGYRKILIPWQEIWAGSLGILSVCLVVLALVIDAVMSILVLDMGGLYEIVKIGTVWGGLLFCLFAAYKAISFSLLTAAELSGVQIRKIEVIYSVLFLVLSIIAKLLAPNILRLLSQNFRRISASLPFLVVAILNIAVVIVSHWAISSGISEIAGNSVGGSEDDEAYTGS